MVYGMVLKKCQAITWTNIDLLPIKSLQSNFNGILWKIQIFTFKTNFWKCHQQNGGHFVHANVLSKPQDEFIIGYVNVDLFDPRL